MSECRWISAYNQIGGDNFIGDINALKKSRTQADVKEEVMNVVYQVPLVGDTPCSRELKRGKVSIAYCSTNDIIQL